jgi:hypothetical protein
VETGAGREAETRPAPGTQKAASQVTKNVAAVSASFPVALDGTAALVLPGSRH